MKSLLAILILLAAIALPSGALAQTEAGTTPIVPTVEGASTDAFDLTDLQNQPLPIRRKIVASELSNILIRLNVLHDKIEVATSRLSENSIDTTSSASELTLAAADLAGAALTIDSLIAAANDIANAEATVLLIEGVPFKDVVIKAETQLRGAREHIIGSLSLLKIAVSSITAAQ